MSKIILENIKGIRKLEFEMPQKSGVHLITGKNGTGKTNLLVALYRICNADAFRDNFPLGANNFDDISQYGITYVNNEGKRVLYSHTNHGWDPHPKRNADILKSFGFANTIYVSASKMRFDVHTPTQLKNQKLKKIRVSPDFIDAMNKILDTTKFNNLRYIQLVNKGRPGRQIRHNNKLYVIENYSENTFSLGERFVLNMLDQLEGVQDKTLVVIDEIELALHPIAQIAFYDYLHDLANAKKLTVIIATHSSSLIKNCRSIYYLENKGGNITVSNKCKPSYILNGLTNEVDNNFDKLFLVEDKMAYYCLETMLSKHYERIPQLLNYKIIYVGGWPQVLEFLKQMNTILPYRQDMVFAYLDYDAQTSLDDLANSSNLNEGQQKDLNNFNDVRQYVSFLHITPEIGMWDWLVVNEQTFLEQWRIKTNNNLFWLNNSIKYIDNVHNNERSSKVCKDCFSDLLDQLKSSTLPEESCRKKIVEIYYEQAIFNDKIWEDINQTLFSQLNK